MSIDGNGIPAENFGKHNGHVHKKAHTSPDLTAKSEKSLDVPAFSLIVRRGSFSGSSIGRIAETQETLDFCGKHNNITADVELIPIHKANKAYERRLKSDVKYRFSIDMSSLKSE